MKRNRIVGQWIVLVSLVWFAMCPGVAAAVEGPVGLQPAFTEADIDWENTTEFPVNPDVKGFAKSREDQILRCVGLRSPGAPHGAWRAGEHPPETMGQPAYCRLAFKQPVTIGTIIQGSAMEVWFDALRPFAGAGVSVLKSTAPFPGEITNDEHWEQVTPLDPMGGAAVFVLPPETQVRAVRLTTPVDGTRFLAGRFTDLAAKARLTASHGDDHRLREGNGWFVKLSQPISPDNPQWLIAAWDEPRKFRGVILYQPSFSECRLEVYRGAAGGDPQSVPDKDWETIAVRTFGAPWRGFQNAVIETDKELETTAVRLVVTQPWVRPNEDVGFWFGGEGHACGLAGLVILNEVGREP